MQNKQLNVLFYAMAGGQLMFMAVVFFLNEGILDETSAFDDTLTLLAPSLALGAFTAAWSVHKMRIAQGAKLASLKEKIDHYRKTFILRSAIIEGGNILLIIAFFLNGRPALLFWFAAGMVFFALFRPTLSNFSRDYQLSMEEEAMARREM